MVAIFDFDGVINKSEYFSVKYGKEFNVSQEEISKFFTSDFNKCARGEADIKRVLPPYLEKWKWKEGVDSFLNYWFQNDIALDHELLSFIGKLKHNGHYVALASQQEVNRKNYIWENLAMKNVFDKFYCTCDLGQLKSNQVFFSIILNDLMACNIIKSNAEIIFFDDSKNFVDAAKASGIESYHIQENHDIFDSLKTRITKLKDI